MSEKKEEKKPDADAKGKKPPKVKATAKRKNKRGGDR